jgi:hypothetical protein
VHAVAAMANLAEMVEGGTQSRMLKAGCLRPLLNLADSPEPEVWFAPAWLGLCSQ